MSAVCLLREARQTLSRPESWTKGAAARDATGMLCDEYDEKATCWCILGAVWRAARENRLDLWGDEVIQVIEALEQKIRCSYGLPGVVPFNDASDTTHDDVLAALDGAIHIAEQWEQQRGECGAF